MINIECGQGWTLKSSAISTFFTTALLTAVISVFLAVPVRAQPEAETHMDDLLGMSLEELANLTVSISNPASERFFESPSALYVITSEQIKNSGMRTIPELMRLVPGMRVKRLDGNKWAISSRRSAARFTQGMLVLMDGRTLYNPLFSGTFWDAQDTLLEDVDRIEVIRGPGSAAWGANAIAGVINVVTKSAKQSQGGLLVAGLGRGEMEYESSGRFGAEFGAGYLSLWAKQRSTDEGRYFDDEESTSPAGFEEQDAEDGILSRSLNLKYDYSTEQSRHYFQAEHYQSDSQDIRLPSATENPTDIERYHFLYQFDTKFNNDLRLQTNTFWDFFSRDSEAFGDERNIFDIEAKLHYSLRQHELSVGLSYRSVEDNTEQKVFGTSGFALNPPSDTMDKVGLFVQDSWRLLDDRLVVLTGVRLEDTDESGLHYNPSLRANYAFKEKTSFWASATRSIRTPSRIETSAYLDFSDFNAFCFAELDPELGCIVRISSESSDPEVTLTNEFGVRHMFNSRSNLSANLFLDREISPLDDSTGETTRHNKFQGFELEFAYEKSTWHMRAGISFLDVTLDPEAAGDDGDEEHWTFQLQNHLQLDSTLHWNVLYMYSEGQQSFDSLHRLDTNLVWRFQPVLELQVSLNNLLDSYHYESADPQRVNSAIRRGGEILLSYRF